MSDYINILFGNMNKIIGIAPVNDDNNKVINEAIIRDHFNGDASAISKFYGFLGNYGVRDGILNEGAGTDEKLTEICKSCTTADCAAILACAKEAKSEDYELYVKAMLLANECFEKMKKAHGDCAKDRVETQKEELKENDRVQDAIQKTEACCK